MAPTLYQSLASVRGSPAPCSGDMYAGVPAASMVCVYSGTSSVTRPKSRSTTRPSRVTSTFKGLMSRCSLPAPWRASTPSASCGMACRSRSRFKAPAGTAFLGLGCIVEPGTAEGREAARGLSLVGIGGPADVPEEVHAVDELHREEPLILVRRQLIEGHEGGVGDVGERPELLLETDEGLRGHIAQGLEGYGDVPLPVDGPIHDPVTARP